MGNAIKVLLEFGPFRLDPDQRLLWRNEQPIPLSPKAFDLLLILAERSGQVASKDELMNLLWPDTFVEESNLGQHIFQLRKALGERAFIITIPGRGYRFTPAVRVIPTASQAGPDVDTPSPASAWIEQRVLKTPSSASTTRLGHRVFAALVAVLILLGGAALLMPSTVAPPRVLSVRQITHSGGVEPFGKVLTDGFRLYFTQRMGGTRALAEMPASGGEPTLIYASVPSGIVYDIDPSQTRLLVGAVSPAFNNPLWVVTTAGGSARRLGDVLAAQSVAWSSDGHSIFFGYNSQIYKVGDEGGVPVRLLVVPGYVTYLRRSPDGSRLRFTVRDSASGVEVLWESFADGRNAHPVPLGWTKTAHEWGEGECCGDWSPDGRYFVFRASHNNVDSFWAIRETPGFFRGHARTPVQIFTTPDHLGEPRFSPNGKKIFFVNYQQRRELVRYDSAHQQFVPHLNGLPARFLSYSHDGKWISYRSEPDGALWRSRADGTEKLQLTFPPLVAYHSTWSADDKKIVFEGRLPGQAAKLYSIASDGGNAQVLLASNTDSDTGPSWSPDGRLILFQRWSSNEVGTRHSAIYELNVETGQIRMLPGSVDFDGVHWSPDGKYVAASDQASHKLMLFDYARQHWSELADGTHGTPYGWGIRWSADSQYVYFQRPEENADQPISRIRISTRTIEQVTSARYILRADVLGYTMTGLTPDGSPLASLIHRNSDIYVLDVDLP